MSRTTATGAFPLGIYANPLVWKTDPLAAAKWAAANEFAFVDFATEDTAVLDVVRGEGVEVGAVDLPRDARPDIMSTDETKRAAAVATLDGFISRFATAGVRTFYTPSIPVDPTLPRGANLDRFIESLRKLAPTLESANAVLVIEGWPGPGAVCTTPETYRAVIDDCESSAIGVNYDPSHLLRAGIDPVRFLREFVGNVFHMHGKDTDVSPDGVYEYGMVQESARYAPERFCGSYWRYTTPGQGQVRWGEALQILETAGYPGGVSIELEDRNFNGTPEGEARGLLAGATFLSSV